MMGFDRRNVLALGLGAAVAACAPSGGGKATAAAGDMALGNPASKVTLIEYASVTCSHCAEFKKNVWPQLKANYVDTKKINFIFREFTTPPNEVSAAGFLVARCGNPTPDQYFTRLEVLFDQQTAVFEALQAGQVRVALLNIAKSAGLTEEQFNACVTDQAGIARIKAGEEVALKEFNITGTPSLILNGEKLNDPSAYTYEGLAKLIDAKLAGA
ncbi:MAG: DsbA family protein [Caulobacterales bacterium]|jgi:protein-disulfide isomerase